jgi:hypothetical protein
MGGEKTGKVAIYLDVRSKSKNNLFSTLFDPGTKNIRRCGGGFPTVII